MESQANGEAHAAQPKSEKQEFKMSDVNQSNGNNTSNALLDAIIAGVGAWAGASGVGRGNNNPAPVAPVAPVAPMYPGYPASGVTTDYVSSQINSLRETIRADNSADQITDLRAAVAAVPGQVDHSVRHVSDKLSCELAGIKESLCHMSHHNAAGFAAGIAATERESAATRQLLLENQLAEERSRNAVLASQVAQAHSDAKHSQTQVLLQQVINQGKA